MHIEHIAIWASNLEKQKAFYEKYFHARAGEEYVNPKKNFHSYFLSFESGCRIELMQMPGVGASQYREGREFTGLAHFAISLGTKEAVDNLTETLRRDGYAIAGEPRTTGDGYYESVVLDPDGNRIELTV